MPLPTKRFFFEECVFDVCEDVYEPAEDSFLFAENLAVSEGDRVLDMGTGSGILAVLAARKTREVVAIDLNPYAIHCASQNAKLNNVASKMHFMQGDLFAPLNESALFDVILFNSPYVPSEEGETDFWLGRSWAGGITGRQVIDNFIGQASKHLQRSGKIFLMQSTLTSVDETVEKFKIHGLTIEVLASRPLPFFETLVLLKAQYQA